MDAVIKDGMHKVQAVILFDAGKKTGEALVDLCP